MKRWIAKVEWEDPMMGALGRGLGYEKPLRTLTCGICCAMVDVRNLSRHQQWHTDLLEEFYKASVGPDAILIDEPETVVVD